VLGSACLIIPMTLAEDSLNIETPENISLGFTVAGIGSRFLAALIDTSLIVVLELLAILPVFALSGRTSAWLMAVLSLIAFGFFWGYYVFFEMFWNGQSPGKRWVGLRVVRAEGTPEGLSESLIRNLIRLIDFLPIAYGVGVITMFIDGRSRRLGDMAGGTLVIHDRPAVKLEALGAVASLVSDPARSRTILGDFPLERLTQADLQLLENYLGRRHQVADSDLLARQILEMLCRRLDHPYDYPAGAAGSVLEQITLLVGRRGQ